MPGFSIVRVNAVAKLIENMDWLHDGSSPVLTLCMLGNFSCFCCHLLIFFQN